MCDDLEAVDLSTKTSLPATGSFVTPNESRLDALPNIQPCECISATDPQQGLNLSTTY